MKTPLFHDMRLCLTLLSVGVGAAALAADKPAAAAGVPTRITEELITITARVEAVDLAQRELTLKGPLGNVVTVAVDERVKRLDDLKPGDLVSASYYLGIVAELRPPTPEEKAEPLVILAGKGKAKPEAAPAVGAARAIRVVGTIEALDRTTRTATLKGPRGRYVTVRVEDPARLEKLHLGETVVVTCAEAIAVEVDKVTR
jgi:hypothetical protein